MFLGQLREFAKPRSTNPRKARDECTCILMQTCYITESHDHLQIPITVRSVTTHCCVQRSEPRNVKTAIKSTQCVTTVHLTNICHLWTLDTSCERSTCTNRYEVQNYNVTSSTFPLTVSLHQCSTFISIYTCCYETGKRAQPGNLPKGNAVSEIEQYAALYCVRYVSCTSSRRGCHVGSIRSQTREYTRAAHLLMIPFLIASRA